MKLILSPRAEKQLKKLPKVAQLIAGAHIRSLIDNKPSQNISPLKGHKYIYRLRVGDYRIVYRNTKKEVYIILIGHRKEIYKLLKQVL